MIKLVLTLNVRVMHAKAGQSCKSFPEQCFGRLAARGDHAASVNAPGGPPHVLIIWPVEFASKSQPFLNFWALIRYKIKCIFIP